jgi:hypothetical protein
LPDDPSAAVTRQRLKNTTEGYRTWTDAEMDQFTARHPIGTKAYLAFVLLRDTGVHRGDAVDLGPQHIRGGRGFATCNALGLTFMNWPATGN